MKIALALEYPLSLRGGVSVIVEELIRGLSPHYRIVLVSNDDSEAIQRSSVSTLIEDHIQWQPEAASFKAAENLADRLHGLDVDLAHFHFGGNYGWGSRMIGQSPVAFAARRGIRCVTTVHSFDSILDGYCGPQKPLWMKLVLLIPAWLGKMHVLWNASAEIAVSQENCRRLRAWYWPLAARFRQIYHSRIDPNPGTRRAETAREPLILSVGHVAFRKGQHRLAEAFATIASTFPEWKLRVIGPIGDKACLERIEAIRDEYELGDRITIRDTSDDVMEWMGRAGIFVQPSTFEGLGLALQEALFCGCACIGTCVGGIPELIDHGNNGLLVSPKNLKELANALERLITDEPLRKKLGARAPLSILEKGMTSKEMVTKHLALYQSLLK